MSLPKRDVMPWTKGTDKKSVPDGKRWPRKKIKPGATRCQSTSSYRAYEKKTPLFQGTILELLYDSASGMG